MSTTRFTTLNCGYYLAVSLQDKPDAWTGPFRSLGEMNEFARQEAGDGVYGWCVDSSGTAHQVSVRVGRVTQ